jgi:hypothetical protein
MQRYGVDLPRTVLTFDVETGLTSSDQSTFPETVGPDLTYSSNGDDAFVAKVCYTMPVGGIVEPVDPLELGGISGESSNGASNIPAIALGIGIAALLALIVCLARRRRVA